MSSRSAAPPPLDWVPPIGSIFVGKYRIDRVLGQGGMGIVFAATHLRLDERVAIKMLLPELASNREVTARFLQEGRAAAKIRGDHVGRVLDVDVVPGTNAPYLVMEFLEGMDLSRLLEARGRLSVQEAVGYITQACLALAEAHALGIVHRDIKPANLFLTKLPDGTWRIKVLDFGIAKVLNPNAGSGEHVKTGTMMQMGSLLYMAPEQLKSTRDVDPRCDVWALGVALYELLCGQPPFDAETAAAVAIKIATEPHRPVRLHVPSVPAPIEGAIARCLEKNPNRRFSTVGELAATIAPFGDDASQYAQRALRLSNRSGADDSARDLGTADTVLGSNPDVARALGSAPTLPRSGGARTDGAWQRATGAPPNASRADRRWGWLAVGGAAVVAAGLMGTAVAWKLMVSDRSTAPATAVAPPLAASGIATIPPIVSPSPEATVIPTSSVPAASLPVASATPSSAPQSAASAATARTARPAPPTRTPSAKPSAGPSGFSNRRDGI